MTNPNLTPFENYLDKHPIVAICFFFFYAWFIGATLRGLVSAWKRKPERPEDLMTDADRTAWLAYKRVSQHIAQDTKESVKTGPKN